MLEKRYKGLLSIEKVGEVKSFSHYELVTVCFMTAPAWNIIFQIC